MRVCPIFPPPHSLSESLGATITNWESDFLVTVAPSCDWQFDVFDFPALCQVSVMETQRREGEMAPKFGCKYDPASGVEQTSRT